MRTYRKVKVVSQVGSNSRTVFLPPSVSEKENGSTEKVFASLGNIATPCISCRLGGAESASGGGADTQGPGTRRGWARNEGQNHFNTSVENRVLERKDPSVEERKEEAKRADCKVLWKLISWTAPLPK